MGRACRAWSHDRRSATSRPPVATVTASRAQFGAHARHDSVHLPGEPVQGSGLHGLHRALADHRARVRQFDLVRSRAALVASASSDTSMPGAMACPRYSPAAETALKVVAVPKSTAMQGAP